MPKDPRCQAVFILVNKRLLTLWRKMSSFVFCCIMRLDLVEHCDTGCGLRSHFLCALLVLVEVVTILSPTGTPEEQSETAAE